MGFLPAPIIGAILGNFTLMRFLRLTPALVFGLSLPALLSAQSWSVAVAPVAADRAGVVVAFPLPGGAPRNLAVHGPRGRLPLQVDADGSARFVVAEIKAGVAPVFTLVPDAVLQMSGAVQSEVTNERVRLGLYGRPVLDYWTKEEPLPNDRVDPKYLRSGHLHPIHTPSGRVISASYPANHLHHHGIWAPWTRTKFQGRTPDFWNMGQGTGKVEFAALERTWSGPVHGGLVARQRHLDLSAPTPVVTLDETWELTVYDVLDAARPVRVFDLVLTQTCATDDPLILPEYHYGGLGFRGHDQWDGADRAFFLTSEGETDRVKGNATRARWLHVGGHVDGHLAGIAILGHPANFRAPEPLRLHPREPFVCFAPSQLGEWRIEPGRPHVARYRFVVLDGPPDRALLDAYWQAYAQPAQAVVTAR